MTARFRAALDAHYRALAELKQTRAEIRAALREWTEQETQKKAAEELGLSPAFICDVLAGNRDWSANRGRTKGL